MIYAIIFRPGPAWKPGVPVFEQDLGPHVGYLHTLQADGSLILAGPFLDDQGGAAVVEVPGEADLNRILANDPGVQSDVRLPETHPWKAVVGRAAQ